jgi:mannitol 2-dehydrogenase
VPETHANPLAPGQDRLQAIAGRTDLPLAVAVPAYDRAALRGGIVHIGVGGFHRAHLAYYADRLAAAGETGWGIIGSGILPGDGPMAEVLAAQDHLYTLVVRGEQHTSAQLIGSLVGYIHAHPDPANLIERIAHPDTQIVSLTITEGGYPVDDGTGAYDPTSPVAGDGSAFNLLARGLQRRHADGIGPLTVMSCDNIVSNGTMSRAATVGESERLSTELARWVDDNIAFPNSMVDRITPMTTDADRAWLAEQAGIDDQWPVVTEPFTLWVLEDNFAGERPPVEKLDVVITDDVEPFEQMKLRLLNAAHSTLAYLSALRGHRKVDEAMADPAIRAFVEAFLEREARPVLPPVPGYNVDEFQNELLERFANPAIGDQIDRLCLDGTAKFPKFLLPTVRAQLAADGPIGLCALALAGWCLYLRAGTDERGEAITVADDPDRERAMALAATSSTDPASFLGYEVVFGSDLAADERFAAAFVDAVQWLERAGVVPSIMESLGD